MMWVLRPGKEGIYYKEFLSSPTLFLPWDGYNVDLSKLKTRDEFRKLVIQEKNPEGRTTISNWSAQLYSFRYDMKPDDIVLIPSKRSKDFAVVKLVGNYIYEKNEAFHHRRNYKLITEGIPRAMFCQATQYSLGAFRTLFKVKQEEEVKSIIIKYKK